MSNYDEKKYYSLKIKHIIREKIWQGMIRASKIKETENPYAMEEFLYEQSPNLNELSEQATNDILTFVEVKK